MYKILHITNWYPSEPTPLSAKWIQNHIKALSPYTINVVFHVEIRKGRLRILNGENEPNYFYWILYLPFTAWRVFEIISFSKILFIILQNKRRKFDIINFHIAYPNCTYINIIRKLVKCPIIITEHWSGYHFNFNIPDPKKRKRIQRIYDNNIPVITVSRSLMKDIKNFSGARFPGYIIHNIVDTNIFNYSSFNNKSDSFLMISQWKWPKDPFTVVKAWKLLIEQLPNAVLKIGGYGQQYDQLKEMILDLELQKNVFLIGLLNSHQIVQELHQSRAFIHCSEYETFSVVCAEALCCGTPVIANEVGGIKEYVDDSNGILVKENNPDSFFTSILEFVDISERFDRKEISREAIAKFSEKKIGKDYYSALTEVISS